LRGRPGTYGTGLALWWGTWFPVDPVVGAACRGCWRGRRGTWRHGRALCVADVATWRSRAGTWRHGPSVCVAGVALMALGWLWWRAWFPVVAVVAAAVGVAGMALGDIDLHFEWQAWRHRRALCVAGVPLTALGWLWWRAWFPVDAVVAAAVGVAGLALGDMDVHFAWRAWHLATSICILRGRRGTYGTGLALVAMGWLLWRARHAEVAF